MSRPQWKTITESLRTSIQTGELAPGHRLPAEQEVADAWGVSRQTAHRAIRELQSEGLVVRQRRWGTVVREKPEVKTGRVAFIYDQFSQSYNFPSWQMINGLQEGLGESFDVICRACRQDLTPDDGLTFQEEARLIHKLSADTDGLIVWPTADPHNTPLLQKVADTRRLVILDRIPVGLTADAVVSDNFEATFRAIRTLIELGHRRIGFFSFRKPGFSTIGERYAAFEKAMTEAGFDEYSKNIRWFARELDLIPQALVQSVYDSLFTLLRQPEPITALFCVQDSLAAATLQACDRIQLRVADDFELATFNDWPPMMLRHPWHIHRIVQSSYNIGLRAGQILANRIAGGTEPPETYRIKAEFFVAGAGLHPDSSQGAQQSPPELPQPMEVN